jgi:hypothetical protein
MRLLHVLYILAPSRPFSHRCCDGHHRHPGCQHHHQHHHDPATARVGARGGGCSRGEKSSSLRRAGRDSHTPALPHDGRMEGGMLRLMLAGRESDEGASVGLAPSACPRSWPALSDGCIMKRTRVFGLRVFRRGPARHRRRCSRSTAPFPKGASTLPPSARSGKLAGRRSASGSR